MKVNEIFYSVQGEGAFTGTPAIFIRLSGCNLRCPFCDTKHQQGTQMSDQEILDVINVFPCSHVVITGGEPTLQLTDDFLMKLKRRGYYIQVETNGTKKVSKLVDWVTCSPKFEFVEHGELKIDRINELKVVYDGKNDMSLYESIDADKYYLQPCDTGDEERNQDIIKDTLDYCLSNAYWHISLQTQKILKVR